MGSTMIATFQIDELSYDMMDPGGYVDHVCKQEPQRDKIEYIRSLNIPVEISVVRRTDTQTYQIRIHANLDDEATLWYRIRYGE